MEEDPQQQPEATLAELEPERPGRKTLLNDQRKKAILDSLQISPKLTDAFRAARISETTGWDWLARGRREREALEREFKLTGTELEPKPSERPFLELLEAIELERHRFKEDLLAIVKNDAIDGGVESAKWLLQKCYPDEFIDQVNITVQSQLNAKLDILEAGLAPDIIRTLTPEQVLPHVLSLLAGTGGASAPRTVGGGPGSATIIARQPGGAPAAGLDSSADPQVLRALPPGTTD